MSESLSDDTILWCFTFHGCSSGYPFPTPCSLTMDHVVVQATHTFVQVLVRPSTLMSEWRRPIAAVMARFRQKRRQLMLSGTDPVKYRFMKEDGPRWKYRSILNCSKQRQYTSLDEEPPHVVRASHIIQGSWSWSVPWCSKTFVHYTILFMCDVRKSCDCTEGGNKYVWSKDIPDRDCIHVVWTWDSKVLFPCYVFIEQINLRRMEFWSVVFATRSKARDFTSSAARWKPCHHLTLRRIAGGAAKQVT